MRSPERTPSKKPLTLMKGISKAGRLRPKTVISPSETPSAPGLTVVKIRMNRDSMNRERKPLSSFQGRIRAAREAAQVSAADNKSPGMEPNVVIDSARRHSSFRPAGERCRRVSPLW